MVTPCVCSQQVRQLTVDTRQPAFRLASVEIGTSTFGQGEKIGEMPTPGSIRRTGFDQAILRVLPHGFQHAVAQLGRPLEIPGPFGFDGGVAGVVGLVPAGPAPVDPKLADELQRRFPGLKVLFMSGYTDGAIVHQAEIRVSGDGAAARLKI